MVFVLISRETVFSGRLSDDCFPKRCLYTVSTNRGLKIMDELIIKKLSYLAPRQLIYFEADVVAVACKVT